MLSAPSLKRVDKVKFLWVSMRMSPVYNYACNCHWYHYRKIKYGLKGSKRKSIESWLTLYQRGKSSLDPTSKLKEVLHLALPAVNFGGSSPHNQQESEIQYLSATSKMTAVLGLFPRQAIQHHSNSSLSPYHWCWRNWSWLVLWRHRRTLITNNNNKKMFYSSLEIGIQK